MSTTLARTRFAPKTSYVYGLCDSGYTLSILRPSAAPSDLTASSFTQSGLTLSWKDNSDNETGFRIQQLILSSWSQVATTGAEITSISIDNLSCGIPRTYRVQAYNAELVSGPSLSLVTGTLPCKPTLTATLNQQGQVVLQANSMATGKLYRFERQGKDGTWTSLGTSNFSYRTFIDTEPPCGQALTVNYRVQAENDQGISPWSEPVSVVINKVCKPTTEITLEAQPISHTAIQVTWTATDGGQDGFILERLMDESEAWVTVATLPKTTMVYLDEYLISGAMYSYRLSAYNAGGQVQGPTISATTPLYEIMLPLIYR